MNYKNFAKILFAAACVGVWSLSSAATNTGKNGNVSRALDNKLAEVTLVSEFEKPVRLSDMVSRRRPGFKDVLVKVDRQTKTCQGVLLAGTPRVATLSACFKGGDGYQMKKVTLRFANGKQAVGTANSVSVQGEFARLYVKRALVQDLKGVEIAHIAAGKSLQQTYSNDGAAMLAQFFTNRGVISPRALRAMGMKPSLKIGTPVFFRGKLVAFANSVPNKFPVSLFGGVSEDSLTVVRPDNGSAILFK